MFFRRAFLLLFLFSVGLRAQVGISGKLKENRTLLRKIEAQIDNLRLKITSSQRKETSVLRQITLLEHEMSLMQRKKGLLRQEVRLLGTQIDSTQKALQQAEKRLQTLRQLYARRAVYAYKYGRQNRWESLLTARSLNQALLRLKYLKQIARHDEALMRLIRKKKAHIKTIQDQLQQALEQKSSVLNALKKQERMYWARKREKQRLLRKLKRSRRAYATLLKQKEQQRSRLLDVIAALERDRKTRKVTVPPRNAPPNFKFQGLAKLKGHLPWPVRGKIITHFGREVDPRSKTVTNNIYVEIKAKEGTPVRCVSPGVVRVITYILGYGNMVFVDHGKGYYTIYAHLSEIDVQKNSFVDRGQIIGKVGDSGYFGPVRLRFSVVTPRGIRNPERWLE